MPGHVMIETMTLEELSEKRTRLVAALLCHTTDERDGMLHSGMEGGINRQYEAMDRLLVEMQ